MSENNRIYRVDKFVVPQAVRGEFLQKVDATHRILRQQPGFVRDVILEQIAGPGRFNIVTIVEWESQAAIDAAREAVTKVHAENGFNPQAFMARLGVQADIANYRPTAV
ncbi:MAG: antibiotic biosynthesis monooxygenase family protein [Gammaproteobacteria bacterium]|jgi:heme-degrading monooxygenase HmoA|nr:antibiotic biosynthesis monooxygenase [Gammaproteobacteria bacterium]